MAELSYSDTATVNLGGSGTAGDPITANLIPLGTACALVDDAPALAKLKDAIDTNTFPVATSWNGADDIFTITMNEGPPLQTTITGFPVNGSYMPNAAGVINIPLTNGNFLVINGTVSPPDLDFASTTVTVGDNGETTIDYLDSDGNVITSSVLAADMDDYLTGLSIAADGCTLEGTMDGGATYSVSLCDLVSSVSATDNADSSTTYTHTDGTGNVTASWTVSPPALRKNATGAASQVTPTTILPAEALLASECVNFTNLETWMDPNGVCTLRRTYTDLFRVQQAINPTIVNVDSTVAVGTVIAEFCFNITVPDCGRRVLFNSVHSLTMQQVPDNRFVTIRPRFSVTGPGGTYTNFATGGEDRSWGNGSVGGEMSYTDFATAVLLPQGVNEICFQLVVERNTISAADGPTADVFASIGRANMTYEFTREICKDA